MSALLEILRRHKQGEAVGIFSACSAHPLVIEAAARRALDDGSVALIEATSNQVNQFGGYTGLRPADFRDRVHAIAEHVGLPRERVMLGGDHLGPNCWQSEPAESALAKSADLVAAYVTAGYRKIHLDCSMSCAGDPPSLGDERIAERTARLCETTERAWQNSGGPAPVYVIGSEVPVPGGAHETLSSLAVTTPAAAAATIAAHRHAFRQRGLDAAWERVVGLVVQPGVEFDHHAVVDYDPSRAVALSRSVESEPLLVFEAHSTDYQTGNSLRALVRDHFAILKVGPALTFAMREALWSLDRIEREILGEADASQLRATILDVMREEPAQWRQHYRSSGQALTLDLQYSLSDRIRYYWPHPKVAAALDRLFHNLRACPPPPALLSQYMPEQFAAVRSGALRPDPAALVVDAINRVLAHYASACGHRTT